MFPKKGRPKAAGSGNQFEQQSPVNDGQMANMGSLQQNDNSIENNGDDMIEDAVETVA